ncbi:selenocysteine lyase/cysteine desulfurase [Virgibacillus halotolerans]|uniref:aminotransferase class V-fold PLP-dependent enzyme n=1 Tax=Virgibacillus halotolerans TaxID=1071053 RepID=UPI001960D057|nr:aminotransferase class V-fold PLP-dependent enzyme [Virgibacillus halotolerans]MBM7599059.1 selenocysteine lyase/cysteine desulfurase [Virgibacillus halotolerans]
MSDRNTEFFPKQLQEFITSSFLYLDQDPYENNRIFFENAGGALRLKSVVEAQSRLSALPDCPERTHDIALGIRKVIEQGTKDIRLFLNAKAGSVATSLTASKLMFEMVTTVAAASQHGNIVTTAIEHPSSYDACQFAAEQYNHELRVAKADPTSGNIPISNILELVDDQTVLVSVILTSNITGAMHDIQKYAAEIKQKNSQTIIMVDGVQGAPHGVIDVDDWKIDALNIAPYKMFGNRGVGFAYLSDRIASLPHHRLLATDKDNWNVGSPTPADFASFTKVIDYICEIGHYFNPTDDRRKLIVEGINRIHLQEQAILNRLVNGTSEMNGTKDISNVTVHFEEVNGVNQDLILALTFDNISCADVVQKYGENNILVYARESSSHYSKRILEAVNLNAIVRVSPIHCHTPEDVDKFLEVTRLIAEGNV